MCGFEIKGIEASILMSFSDVYPWELLIPRSDLLGQLSVRCTKSTLNIRFMDLVSSSV